MYSGTLHESRVISYLSSAHTRRRRYAFGYPVAAAAGSFAIAYVHYPFVSTDMLQRVRDRVVEFNNTAHISNRWDSPLDRVSLPATWDIVNYTGLYGKIQSMAFDKFYPNQVASN